MKLVKKAFITGIRFMLVLSFLILSVPAVFAATPKVTVSLDSNKTNVRIGNTFIVYVSLDIQNGGGTLIDSFSSGIDVEYENSLFELINVVGSNSISVRKGNPVTITYQRNEDACEDINSQIATLTFQVKTTAVLGESSFKVSGAKTFKDGDGNSIPVSYTSPYTAVTIADKMSDNNFLSNLVVNEGTLSPKFKKETTQYSVKVANNVSRVNLVYSPEDKGAKVTVTNAANLKVGANTVKVVVTAEDGSTRLYTLTVTRADNSSSSDTESISSSPAAGITQDQYNKDLQKVKNRYLIFILILIFAVLAELAYILIEKFAKKKQPLLAENSPNESADAEGTDASDKEIGEPQSIIDSILNNNDDENNSDK